MPLPTADSDKPRRVLLLGGTGTIGRATARALLRRGHQVVGFVRPRAAGQAQAQTHAADAQRLAAGIEWREGTITEPGALARDGIRGERFDAIVSCLASRSGAPADAWAIDHRAHSLALQAAQAAGIPQFVLLSAICVQKPLLAFQQAKLAFEKELVESGMNYSIVRPTAFFKSLSGQVERVRRGKPFLVFGDGTLTACKPISDDDLGDYLAACLEDPALQRRVLPVGGPGDAMTPRQQGEMLFALLDRPPKFKQVPLRMMDAIVGVLGTLGRISPKLAAKAELARIGRYYASESMLMLNPETGRYDARATPSTGTQTLGDHYARLLRGEVADDRGEHAVF